MLRSLTKGKFPFAPEEKVKGQESLGVKWNHVREGPKFPSELDKKDHCIKEERKEMSVKSLEEGRMEGRRTGWKVLTHCLD